jgi:uncharacterized membrane protein
MLFVISEVKAFTWDFICNLFFDMMTKDLAEKE